MLFAAVVFVRAVVAPHPVYRTFKVSIPSNTAEGGGPQLVDFNGIGLAQLGVWGAHYLLIALVGFALLSQSTTLRRESIWLRLPAGFFLGYLATCAIARVGSTFLMGTPFFIFCWLALLATFALCAREWLPTLKFKSALTSRLRLVLGALLIFVLGASLIQLSYFHDFRWVGHSYTQYASRMAEWELGLFPIFDQHYDEYVFHHFLAASHFVGGFNAIVPWWITLGLNKVSVFAFCFLAARACGARTWDALLISVFLFFGALSIVPSSYELLYDSANPLFFTAHSGRLVGIPFFIFWLLLFREPSRPAGWIQVLLFGGIAATSVSNLIWMLLLLFILAAFSGPDFPRTKVRALALRSLIFTPVLYLFPQPLALVWLKLTTLVAHLLNSTWLREIYCRPLRIGRNLVKSPYVWAVAGALIFSLLFGNVLSNNPLNRSLKELVSSFGPPLESYQLAPAKLKTVRPLSELISDHREIENFNYYCHSIYYFLAILGGLLTLAWLTLKHRFEAAVSKEDRPLELVLYAMVFALPFLFFFVEFVGVGERGWVRSRFLEIPVNTIVFLSLIFLFQIAKGRKELALRAYLVVYSVLPFLITGRPQQILLNWEMLKSLMPS